MLEDKLKYITYLMFFIAWMFATGLLFRWIYDSSGWVQWNIDMLAGPTLGMYVLLIFISVLALITFIPLAFLCYITLRLVFYLEFRLKKDN